MTNSLELEYLKTLRRIYAINLVIKITNFGFKSTSFNVIHYGMCNVINYAFNSTITIHDLPHLKTYKPKITYGLFWFKPGRLLPRLRVINKAIKDIQNERIFHKKGS
jgi:hypothetical protein